MRLQAWRTVWVVFLFNRRTGLYWPVITRREDPTVSGFGDIVCPLARPLCFSAVYAEAGKLFFQFGWRRWNLDSDDLDIKHYHLSNKCFSRFEIRQSGRKVLAFTYPHVLRTLYANLDPTYDQIDHDADFFLAFLADHAKDAEWRTNAMKMWDESRRGR